LQRAEKRIDRGFEAAKQIALDAIREAGGAVCLTD
jgi:hypothetical protein